MRSIPCWKAPVFDPGVLLMNQPIEPTGRPSRWLTPRRVALGVLGFASLLALTVIFALASGPSSLAFGDVVSALRGEAVPDHIADIVLRVRLPRVMLGVAVGAALAVAGVLFQALLRNPLADPFVLGVSGGAALGAMLILSLGAGFGLGYAAVPPAAFAGAPIRAPI